MVTPLEIGNDVLQTVIFLVLPGLLWLALLRICWSDPALARASGFTRPIFWLLLPGAIVGSFGNLPLFAWNGDVLAIDVGGAILPLVVSCWLMARAFGDRARLWALFFGGLGVECVLGFVGEFEIASALLYVAFLVATLVGGAVAMAIVYGRAPAPLRPTAGRAAVLLALTNSVLFATFLSTQAIPNYGIVSVFPWFLVVPVVVGAAVAGFARPAFGIPPVPALGLAYGGTTFGVLLGADLLRQPPLYGTGGEILSIGGAGTNDLVFLSGLLAVAAGLVVLRISRQSTTNTEAWSPSYLRPEPPRPGPILRQSLRLAIEGSPKSSLALAEQAVEVAEVQARRLLGTPPGRSALSGLPAPPWMAADRQNLAALARLPDPSPRDSTRGWLTARWLVRFLAATSSRRFADPYRRGFAYATDLLLLMVPGFLLWYATIATIPGDAVNVLDSIPVNAAVYLFAALGFLYFVLMEAATGTTIGKWLWGLEVRDRRLELPDGLATLLRNLPKLIPLTTIAIGGVAALALAIRGLPGGSNSFVGTDLATVIYLLIAIGGVAFPGLVSLGVMLASPERQRLGDWFAGTWVINVARPERRATRAGVRVEVPFG